MDYTEIITLIIQAILAPLMIWGVKEAIAYLKERTQNDKLRFIIDLTEDVVIDAVRKTEQTFVDELKESGEWNQAKAQEALLIALEEAKTTLGQGGELLLKQAVGDINTYILNKIEATVHTVHEEKKDIVLIE